MFTKLTPRDGICRLINMTLVEICEPDAKGGTRLLMRGRSVVVRESIDDVHQKAGSIQRTSRPVGILDDPEIGARTSDA